MRKAIVTLIFIFTALNSFGAVSKKAQFIANKFINMYQNHKYVELYNNCTDTMKKKIMEGAKINAKKLVEHNWSKFNLFQRQAAQRFLAKTGIEFIKEYEKLFRKAPKFNYNIKLDESFENSKSVQVQFKLKDKLHILTFLIGPKGQWLLDSNVEMKKRKPLF